MRPAILWLAILSISHLGLLAQMIDNPSQPADPDAGRVMNLEKALTISDQGKPFIFQSPRLVRISPNGHIFVVDKEAMLEFNPKGRFLRNLFQKGEGPGELLEISELAFRDGEIVIWQNLPPKFLILNEAGEIVTELRLKKLTDRMLAALPDRMIMARDEFKGGKPAGEGFVDVIWKLQTVEAGGTIREMDAQFATQLYGMRLGTDFIANRVTDLLTALLEPGLLAVCHTEEYEIALLDTQSGRILRRFRRSYRRVWAGTKKGWEQREGYQTLSVPRKYHNDIQRLFVHRGRLWVLTSTRSEKGWLIDVFDSQGRYLDNFYLPVLRDVDLRDIASRPFAVTEDAVWTFEAGSDDLPVLTKYLIRRKKNEAMTKEVEHQGKPIGEREFKFYSYCQHLLIAGLSGSSAPPGF